MKEAEELFNKIWFGSMSRWFAIDSFTEVAFAGVPLAVKKLSERHERFVSEFFHGPEYEELFTDREKALEGMSIAKTADRMTIKTADDFQNSVNAASILFAHSILDNVALDYCRVSALIAPQDWAPVVEKRKVELREIAGASYDDILQKKLDQFLNQDLAYKSLLSKIDRLFGLCKPEPGFSPLNDYSYDRDRLQKLDEIRHEIVHGDSAMPQLTNIEEDILYLRQTSSYLMALLGHKYNLKIDPEFMSKFYSKPDE